MRNQRRVLDWLWIPLVLLFLVPVVVSISGHSRHDRPSEQGMLILGRSGLDSLISEAGGRPVLINFWATWCTPCVGELPEIDMVYAESNGGIQAIAVDIGDPDLETLLEFREAFSVSMPVVWLNQEEAQRLKAEWELADVLPITLFLDTDGAETSRIYGARSIEFFENALSGVDLPDTSSVEDHGDYALHINVAGDPEELLTLQLIELSIELAGEEGVDIFDPADPDDLAMLDSLYLPASGYPYAQPCVGDACGRPSRSVEELLQAVEALSP